MAMNIGITDTGYESIAPYRLYLDPSLDDVEFQTLLPNPLSFTEADTHHSNFINVGDFVPKRTMWDIISNDPRTIPFADILKGYRLDDYLNGTRWNISNQITLFVPISNVNSILWNIQSFPYRMENILKYHMINYPVLPVQLFNATNRIETLKRNDYLTVHGTDNELFLLHPNDRRYRNKIVQTMRTDNGIIYFIEQPEIPTLY